MRILSLFDGIACGRVALERAGIKVDKYYASEIDKYAIQVATSNYPDIIELGDINNWQDWEIEWNKIDLIIGGSPCQGFSMAGKMLNFNDNRSKLFFVYVDILNYVKKLNPNVLFLLENVKMKQEWVDIISKYLLTAPIEINSALVSAQNRKRLYWTNISGVTLPQDKNIKVCDILDNGNNFKFCNDKNVKHIMRPFGSKAQLVTKDSEKTPTLIAAMGMGGGNGIYYAEQVQCGGYIIKDHELFIDNDKFETKINDGFYRFRKLTPTECERLQTLPDNYTKSLSDTQRYKCLGNGWTVDVIAWIFSFIPNK